MSTALHRRYRVRRRPSRGFTLVELLVTITIISILASVLLGTLFFSAEKARDARTRSMITRLDQAITIRWETYRTRRVPVDPRAAAIFYGLDPTNAQHVALVRLLALRELMRMELPDRWSDVEDDPVFAASIPGGMRRPAISHAYLQRYMENIDPQTGALGSPSLPLQSAECLYLIVTTGGLGDDAVTEDHFRGADVGDTDEDGAPEFLDGWGRPIRFLRWAPGFVSELQPMMVDDPATSGVDESLLRDLLNNHDPFDPLKVDLPDDDPASDIDLAAFPLKASPLRGGTNNTLAGYRLFPLIYSAGSDGVVDIRGDISDIPANILRYSTTTPANDPYHDPDPSDPDPNRFIGSPADIDSDGLNHLDNIHNHILGGSVR